MNCPHCGYPSADSDVFCGNCGHQLSTNPQAASRCPDCATITGEEDFICPKCGRNLETIVKIIPSAYDKGSWKYDLWITDKRLLVTKAANIFGILPYPNNAQLQTYNLQAGVPPHEEVQSLNSSTPVEISSTIDRMFAGNTEGSLNRALLRVQVTPKGSQASENPIDWDKSNFAIPYGQIESLALTQTKKGNLYFIYPKLKDGRRLKFRAVMASGKALMTYADGLSLFGKVKPLEGILKQE